MKNKKVKYDYAYTDEMFERATELLESKIASTPTQAARMVCEENELEYNESIGRTYRKHFNGNSLLLNSVGYKEAQERQLPKSLIYFISSAQNNTKVNKNLLKNMEVYANKLSAKIGIVASRYRNPNLFDEGLKDNYWDDRIKDYLIASRYKLHKDLIIGADVFVPYTTKRPLNVAKQMSGEQSFIVGHPKQDLQSIPTLEGAHEKYVYSTGSVSLPDNYSKTMAGSVAQRNHKMGFLIVILAGDKVVVRNVEADVKGNFQDLKVKVENGEIKEEEGQIESMVLGDLHSLYHDPKVLRRTDGLIDLLKPKKIVLHDVLSAESISYFTRRDIFKRLELMDKGFDSLETEIEASLEMIEHFRKNSDILIPQANHHNFIDRWLTDTDWKKDTTNARIFLELARIKASKDIDTSKGIYALLVDSHFKDKKGYKVETIGYNKSYKIKGIELSQHGDKGTNGKRGSVVQYENTGIPHIVAHGHSPEKRGDILMVGTSTKKRMGYNQGYSGWRALHGITTGNGKMQYIQL